MKQKAAPMWNGFATGILHGNEPMKEMK